MKHTQNVARWLSHTHTHTFFIAAIFCMMAGLLTAQSAGSLSFGSVSVNTTTGYASMPVYWTNNQITGNVYAVRIDLYLSSTGLCFDGNATKNSIASPFNASNVSVSGTSLSISKTNVTLPTDFSPLITLYFRGAPNQIVQIGVGSLHQVLVSFPGTPSIIGLPGTNPISYTVPSGYSISGLIRKAPMAWTDAPPAQCEKGADSGIPYLSVAFKNYSSCFASTNPNPYDEYSSDGYYSTFNLPRYYTYSIRPRKNTDTPCGCGVTQADIDTARSYIMGLKIPGSLYQLIAADFNGNDTVSTYDLLNMARCSLNIEIEDPGFIWRPWRFVPVTAYNSNNPPTTSPIVPPLPDSIITASLSGNLGGQDFYGIKRGDLVEQSCTDCGESIAPSGEDREPFLLRNIYIDNIALVAGQEYEIPVYFSKLEGLTILGLSFSFDSEVLEILGVEKVNASKEDYLVQKIERGKHIDALRFIWFNMKKEGESVENQTPLFRLKLSAKQTITTLQSYIWQNKGGESNDARGNGQEVTLNLEFKDENLSKFDVKLLGLNPTNATSTQLAVFSSQAVPLSIAVFDSNGKLILGKDVNVEQGWTTSYLDGLPVTPGIYHVRVSSNIGYKTLRFVKI